MFKKTIVINLVILFMVLPITKIISQPTPVIKSNYAAAERFSPEKLKKMVFDTRVSPNWLTIGDRFWYSFKTSNSTSYYIVNLDKKTKNPLFDNHKMARMLSLITKDPYDRKHLPEIKPKFKNNDAVFQFDVTSTQDEEKKDDDKDVKEDEEKKDDDKDVKEENGKDQDNKEKKVKKKVFHLEYNLSTEELYEIKDWKEEKEDPSWAQISPNGEYVVFARDYNLFWMDKENYLKAKNEEKGEKDSTIVEHQFTTDGEQYYAYGGGYTIDHNLTRKKIKEESEKRRSTQIYWSPDSRKFALERTDSRKVKDLWVINSLAEPRPTLETYKYHMPGEEEASQNELWVFDMTKKEGSKVNVEKFKDQTLSIHGANRTNKEKIPDYVPSIWLSKSSDEVYFSRISRDLHKNDVCVYTISTGEVKILVEERLNTYVDTKPTFLVNNGTEIIHWSERDGWAHFYLYDGKGNLKNQITSGPWHCENIVKVDGKNRILYFTANGREKNENPYYQHLYKVNFDGSGLQMLNKGDYTSVGLGNARGTGLMSDSYNYFINNYSRVNTTPKSEIRDNFGRLVLELETADLSNLFAAGYKFPEPYKAKAADGITDIYGVLYTPFDMNSNVKYPLIEYVYPGPQTEAVNTAFSARMDRTDRLAQLGFVVITLGNRGGHPARSKWYHNYGYGDLRDYGLADKKYVAEQLADKYDYIDIDRVGITGHSGGGFMSTAALCQYPDFFKVAVSSSGNHENDIYNRWWSEKHHGVKEIIEEENQIKFLYEIEKNSQLAKNLKGKLLITTGDIDNNVHPGNTFRMANALIKANKRFDLFIFPGQHHGYGNQTEYFFWLKGDYFCQHLIGDYSISTDIFEMRREFKMTPSKKEAK
ncbi:MAG: prolyl oligopeptidase family serine peptidase [Bacteroidetes bacterium]|nr:prolyl oligopeptidase family serine peptidase [Bacteroidota bacterium]